MTSYSGFFSASASVAGALTGLLFVALSVSPERLRQSAGSLEHQAIAATAFTALIDALFVSLAGLTPGGVRLASVILSLVGLSSSVTLARRLWKARDDETLTKRWPVLMSLIIVMYAAQCVLGLTVTGVARADSDSVTFIMMMFAVGIARCWELLGLSGGGIFDLIAERLKR